MKQTIKKRTSSVQEAYRWMASLEQFRQQRDWSRAVETADRIAATGTQDKHIWEAVLGTYIDGGAKEQALAGARQYEKLFGLDGQGCFLRGRAEFMNDQWEEAEHFFYEALQRPMPDWYRGACYSILATLCRMLGNPEKAAVYYLESVKYKQLDTGKLAEYSNYLFNLHYLEISQEKLLAAAQGFGRLLQAFPRYEYNHRHRHDKLRIGYASPDLHFHVVAFFSYAFLKNYDKNCFAVYCYTDCVEDSASREFQAAVDVWHNVRGLEASRVAKLIYEDEIDILVDLAGHTADNFLQVFAYKPAPLQVSGIGYFDTTGLPQMDYFLADGYTDPVEPQPGSRANDQYFTERLLRLPHSHFCYMWHDRPSLPEAAPCLHKGCVTFGCLNNFAKITDKMLRLWAEILRRVPQSRLYLRSRMFNNDYSRRLAMNRIQAAGIPAVQLICQPFAAVYLDSYKEIDIALDTYPYPGGGTTCDALYMGVPVITLAGERHNARFGYSLLMNIGLEECCAFTPEEYVEKAVSLARSQVHLNDLHLTLRRRMRESPVMQGDAYMAEVETAYRRIWRRYQPDEMSSDARLERMEQALRQEHWAEAVQEAGWLQENPAYAGRACLAAGIAYGRLGKWGRAVWQLRQALPLLPERDAEIYRLLAEAERGCNCWTAAYEAASRAEKSLQAGDTPNADFLRNVLVLKAHNALFIGKAAEAASAYRQAAALPGALSERCRLYSSWLMARHNYQNNEADFLRSHSGYAVLFQGIESYRHARPANTGKRLRIGYLSPDFRRHVMFYFYYQLLAGRSAADFEVYAYSLGHTKDGFTQSVRECTDVWRDVSDMSYEAIARQIKADGIDILVDLAGHSAGSGLPVLAWKPAPVQVSGLGYMAATGLPTVDYFLTDAFTDPADGPRSFLTETPVCLTSQFCYTGRSDVPESQGAFCQNSDVFMLGVFNQYAKITDEMLLLWKALLKKIPQGRLLFKNNSFTDDGTVDMAYTRLQKLGYDMGQVIFEGASDDYMERYLDVDIALDTYPYTGGGTTCDALYMGVPVVSLYGGRRGSRFGLSILQNAGLGELAVNSPAAYEERVLALANDRELLDMLHKNLRSMLLQSPLMDTKRYVAEVEQAYRQMWKIYMGD